LDRVFSLQHERVVNRDNTVQLDQRVLQIEKTLWRGTLAGCRVTLCEHLDGRLTIHYGPHLVAAFSAEGLPARKAKRAIQDQTGGNLRGGGTAVFGANLSRPTGSFGQRRRKSETGQIVCYKNRTF